MNKALFQIIKTADGSPSLEWATTGEAMHNRMGAFAESVALYGEAIENAVKTFNQLKLLSIGLGLGYNELITASVCLKFNLKSFYIESFETDEILRMNFLNWLDGQEPSLKTCYDQILNLCANYFLLNSSDIKNNLVKAYSNHQFNLRKQLNKDTVFTNKFNCILYDPFSAKTNPECWDEDFLNNFLEKVCESNCIFSTYAAKGTLKRSLKGQGFVVKNPPGFGGKRNSTYAYMLIQGLTSPNSSMRSKV
ncbi:MAG: hypothetical protein KDD58_00150 [Bdellovibrionales bacterium]|nr:hypothetical protein [Bdellovibrionales bacterium]